MSLRKLCNTFGPGWMEPTERKAEVRPQAEKTKTADDLRSERKCKDLHLCRANRSAWAYGFLRSKKARLAIIDEPYHVYF